MLRPATGTNKAAGGIMRNVCAPRAPITAVSAPRTKFDASETLYAFKNLARRDNVRKPAGNQVICLIPEESQGIYGDLIQ